MAAAMNILEEAIGGHLLRTSTWNKPAAIYVALYKTLPSDDGTGGVEVAGGGYTRVQCGPGDAEWSEPSDGDGCFANAVPITFPTPTANWGTVVGFGLWSAATGGTLYLVGSVMPVVGAVGAPALSFAAGALRVVFQ